MSVKKIYLKPGKEKSLQRQHPWVFSGALAPGHETTADGTIIQLVDNYKKIQATGFYSPSSIAVRILHFGEISVDQAFYNQKIRQAFELRKKLNLPEKNTTNCYRLIHGEGDGFPGLIIDVYANTAVVQCHTSGYHVFLEEIKNAVIEFSSGEIKFVYFKSKESNNPEQKGNDKFIGDEGQSEIEVIENGNKFYVNIVTGQKTGFFLDQRDNRELLKKYSKNLNVLNTFSYSGGFSVYALAAGAKHVASVDISQKAIDLCNKNITLNGFTNHESLVADVVDYIKEVGDDYDVIILDPPAFAKHLSAKHKAVIGYKRINLEAIKKIKSGGIIFTFSCSQAVNRELFESTVCAAAIEAGRDVQILHRMNQPADHPVSIFHPEGHYLKGLVIHVR
jgi:23S rRNA (cytosine1962-C5)-methyltransferase